MNSDEPTLTEANMDGLVQKLQEMITTSESNVSSKLETIECNVKQYVNDVVFGYIDNIIKHTTNNHSTDNSSQTVEPELTQTNDVTKIVHDHPPGRLRVSRSDQAQRDNRRSKHDVFIGNMSVTITLDVVRAHLMDIDVSDITNIQPMVDDDPSCVSFRVAINDDTTKNTVYNKSNFEHGIIVKPYRFHQQSDSATRVTDVTTIIITPTSRMIEIMCNLIHIHKHPLSTINLYKFKNLLLDSCVLSTCSCI